MPTVQTVPTVPTVTAVAGDTPLASTSPTHAPGRPAHDAELVESSTRQRVLRLVAEAGPVSVVDLARALRLTGPGVRRHVAALEDAGQVQVHQVTATAPARRGRPARRYVVTDLGQAALSDAYEDLATQALRYLAAIGGEAAVAGFAERRAQDLRARHEDVVAAAGPDVVDRTEALAASLSQDGYAASTRPVPAGRAVQLCQGHCPVQHVAAQFPQLCEAETRAFSQMLGVHVQRLSTLASGGHVCTTHVPTTTAVQSTAVQSTAVQSAVPSPEVRPTSDRPAAAETVEGTR